MKKYLKTYVAWLIWCFVCVAISTWLVQIFGQEPEYVGLAVLLSPILAIAPTWSTCYEPKHNEG